MQNGICSAVTDKVSAYHHFKHLNFRPVVHEFEHNLWIIGVRNRGVYAASGAAHFSKSTPIPN
jgi:hypothetical protein